MKKNLTEIVFILDRSGSMASLAEDAIGGFNAMIEKQKLESGEAYISTVLFNQDSQVVHDRVDVQKVHPMTRKEYVPAGCTALLDAVGGAFTTSATSTNTPARRMCRSTRSSSSPPTAWRTPPAVTPISK